jgi:hypothetical protein
VIAAELGHRLSEPDVLMRLGEIAAERRDDLLAVTVEHGKPLAKPAGRATVLVRFAGDRLPQRREPALAERVPVADRVGLEEVLVAEAETDDPRGELERVGDAGVACASIRGEEVPGELADQPGGVVGPRLQDLDDVADRALQQLDELA